MLESQIWPDYEDEQYKHTQYIYNKQAFHDLSRTDNAAQAPPNGERHASRDDVFMGYIAD